MQTRSYQSCLTKMERRCGEQRSLKAGAPATVSFAGSDCLCLHPLLPPPRVCPDDVSLRPPRDSSRSANSHRRGEELSSPHPAVAAESPGCTGGWGLPAPRGGAHPGPPPLRTVKDSQLLQLEKGGARRRGGHSAKPVEDMQGAKCHVPSRCWLGGPGSPPADPTQQACLPSGQSLSAPS